MIVPQAWSHLPFFSAEWPNIRGRLAGVEFLPGPDTVFRALALTAPENVRVIIIGQDPYPTPGHADGLAFSVTPKTPLPRSLSNIYKEMREDIHAYPANGDLSHLARQGVLLLNTSLSVLPGQAGSHAKLGWDGLARQVVAEAQGRRPLAFVLWGQHAQAAVGGLARPVDLVIATSHPSPLSARRGFVGSRPFSAVNHWLQMHDESPIDWAGLSSDGAPH